MKTSKTLCQLLLFTFLCTTQLYASLPSDKKIRLTQQWEFIRQDMGSPWEVMRPAQPGKPESVPLWQKVTLPHCFNAEDATNPDVNYYQGAGWYRTTLDINNPYANGKTYLEFEGAGQKTEVYVYTTLVAKHVGGYDEWKADITDAVARIKTNSVLMKRFSGKIPITIRCDNGRDTQTIPSDMSDFNLYGGLYRYVNLVYVPAWHMDAIRIDSQTDEKGRNGEVTITVLPEDSKAKDEAKVSVRIFSPEGKEVFSSPLNNKESNGYTVNFDLKKPQLWSPEKPSLYTCKVQAVYHADTLTATQRFGFRHFRFEEQGPFYLNGKRYLLRGTHRHEDHAGVGAALTEEMMQCEMRQIKEMGANFIRLGHYQQSRIILDLCDELGLLVWEEIPWCRGGLGNPTYKEQARRMLTNMITQHRNHPSVILWGLGNENDWPGDFETFNKDSIRSFMSELNELAHQLDSSRCTVIRRCDFCKDIVDVYSPSIWAGWYSNKFTDYRQKTEQGIQSVPHFLHAEWGGDSHPGRHTENRKMLEEVVAGDRNGDWSESYIVRLFDWHLKEQEQMPQLTGSLFWTFKDFSTPLRPRNPIPYVKRKGVVQRDGTPKESYYVFQSYWSDKPMVHIYGHSQPIRWGTTEELKEVLVYSNCPEVELFVNGVSQGIRKRDSQDFPAAGLRWQVKLKEGENQLKAIARKGKQQLTDEINQEYQTQRWGTPAQIRLTQVTTNDAIGKKTLIRAELLDANGVRCLDAADFVRFGCTESSALLQNQGTAHGSQLIQMANGRAEICVKPMQIPVIVSVRDEAGKLTPAFIRVEATKREEINIH